MTDLRIRVATARDLPAVLDLWRRAEAPPTRTDDLDALTVLVARDAEALIVAEAEGELAGTVIAGWDGWRGNIYRIAVLPERRRRGIARALVADAARRLDALGVRRTGALVARDDGQARGFWDAAGSGFVLADGHVRYARDS